MNIILFGFKKCGKTYYGLKMAEILHMNFIDSDLLTEKIYTKIHHQTLSYREIVKKHGFPFFRNLEKQAVSLIMQEKNSIIALGGGVVLDPENIERLKQVGLLIYLKASKKTLKHRTISHELPAYLDPLHPAESFDDLYEERLPIYEGIKAPCIDTTDSTEETILEELKKIISQNEK